jgi:hypothetical protein
VFYPDAVDPAKAQIIEVSEGSEAKDIDIALGAAVQTFSASGRVINSETGAPVRNIRFGLQRIIAPERFEFVNSVAVTNARGDFVVDGLIPGKYSTTMFSGEANELRAEPITFDVVDQDVSGVVVKLARGATVSGVVVLESDVKTAQRLLAETMMRGYVQSKTGYGNSASSPIAADGSFRLSGLPTGAVNISISGTVSPYPPKGLSISRIERDGIVRPRIEVEIGEQVTGVKVFIGYGTGILRGVVKIENGPLPSTARVFVQLRKPGENAPNLRFAQLDERGYFLMEGLAPGQYEVLANVVGGNLKSPKPIRQEVSLNDGAVTEVTITVDVATLTTPQ